MRTNIIINLEGKKRYPLFFMSDFHSDDNDFDEEAFETDIEAAIQRGCGIFVGGDVYSLLLPKDMKRFTGSRAKMGDEHPIDAYVNNAVLSTAERFKPYVNHIHAIGVGNHESSSVKFNGVDPVQLLIHELNKYRDIDKFGKIQQMGYKGFITLRFKRPYEESHYDHAYIWYDHGRGGGAVVTKGMIDITRTISYVEGVDVVWLQHKHVRWADPSIKKWFPNQRGEPAIRRIIGMITGTYQKDLVIDDYEKTSGYVIHFGEEKQFAPQGTGGIQIDFEPAKTRLTRTEIKKYVIMEC